MPCSERSDRMRSERGSPGWSQPSSVASPCLGPWFVSGVLDKGLGILCSFSCGWENIRD